jgi:hypothetical protein
MSAGKQLSDLTLVAIEPGLRIADIKSWHVGPDDERIRAFAKVS